MFTPGLERVPEPLGFPFELFFVLPFFLPLLGVAVIVLFVVAGIRGETAAPGERRGRWLPLVYYYLATVVGLAITLTGLIGGLNGAVTAAFPTTGEDFIYSEPPYDEQGNPIRESKSEKAEREAEARELSRRSGIAGAIRGATTGIVGFPVFFWHLRQARRKEPEWLGLTP